MLKEPLVQQLIVFLIISLAVVLQSYILDLNGFSGLALVGIELFITQGFFKNLK